MNTDELLKALLDELRGLRRDLRRAHPEIWPPQMRKNIGVVVATESVPRTLTYEQEESMEFAEQRTFPGRRRTP